MKFILSIVVLLLSTGVNAQKTFTEKEYKQTAHWITMMDEPKANYFEVIKAFEMYWINHKMPEGESDMNVRQKEKNTKRFSNKELRSARQDASMRMKIKKYYWWKEKMEPFVKGDGTIMSAEERRKL
jgi:hypothetical protein